jgi:putative addiction module component (TIGR02574 family)
MPKSHPAPDRVLADALRLKAKDRAALVNSLLASVDIDPEVLAAWEDEAARRLKEIDSGAVKAIPWATAQKRIFARKRKKA